MINTQTQGQADTVAPIDMFIHTYVQYCVSPLRKTLGVPIQLFASEKLHCLT